MLTFVIDILTTTRCWYTGDANASTLDPYWCWAHEVPLVVRFSM